MAHRLGVSGSVILSDQQQFPELFWEGINHIEIGEFLDEIAFGYFLELCKEQQTSFGIHSPLYRNTSKNDLIEKVQYEPEYAWEQLELEAEQMSVLGAKYILVHFPYFKHEITGNVNEIIEQGLRRLSDLQQKYRIPVICEPKLGIGRSPGGIHYLHHFPKEIWDNYGLKLCIDIGDYVMATDDQIIYYLLKWKEHIKVVHLHNVQYMNNKYIWVPVHPAHENDGIHYKIEEVIRLLAEHCEDLTFIFEHTPHSNPSKDFVEEGYRWIESLIDKQVK